MTQSWLHWKTLEVLTTSNRSKSQNRLREIFCLKVNSWRIRLGRSSRCFIAFGNFLGSLAGVENSRKWRLFCIYIYCFFPYLNFIDVCWWHWEAICGTALSFFEVVSRSSSWHTFTKLCPRNASLVKLKGPSSERILQQFIPVTSKGPMVQIDFRICD